MFFLLLLRSGQPFRSRSCIWGPGRASALYQGYCKGLCERNGVIMQHSQRGAANLSLLSQSLPWPPTLFLWLWFPLQFGSSINKSLFDASTRIWSRRRKQNQSTWWEQVGSGASGGVSAPLEGWGSDFIYYHVIIKIGKISAWFYSQERSPKEDPILTILREHSLQEGAERGNMHLRDGENLKRWCQGGEARICEVQQQSQWDWRGSI